MKLCIAVPTYRRPHLLSEMLESIRVQAFEASLPEMELLVIDNDQHASAKGVVERFRAAALNRIHYAVVPQPGLSQVRNYALRFAARGFDALVMTDDDQTVDRRWLDELLRVRGKTGADAVVGPVLSAFPPNAPTWIIKGEFFRLMTFEDECFIDDGYTGNCLLVPAAVAAYGLAFDPQMDLGGGEDQLFFRQMRAAGGRIAYAAKAVAVEHVLPDRLNLRYLLRRSYRRGNTLAICDRKIQPGEGWQVIRTAKGGGRIVVGVASLIPRFLTQGRAGGAWALSDIVRGWGMLVGLAGKTVLEYRRTPLACEADAPSITTGAVSPPSQR